MTPTSPVSRPFVEGHAVEPGSGVVSVVREPATGEPLGQVLLADEGCVDSAVLAARRALDGPWRRTSPVARSRLLHRLADELESRHDALSQLEARNVGKAITSVRAEVSHAVNTFRYFAAATAAIEGKSSRLNGALAFQSFREPVGVVAQIVPWNYPLLMAAWKVAPALAAGCTVVLKPDPATPLTALRLAELALVAGIPPGVLNVVPADGPRVGSHLVRHAGVDRVAFTGSTVTGGEVMRLAADPVKRVSLELGGKSPTVVFADADLDDAVPGAVWGAFTCAGQSCEARSRVLVEDEVFDRFLERFADQSRSLRVGDPLDPDTVVGSLISTAHRERVHGFVERARVGGAQVLLGGAVPSGPGAFYPPTVVLAPQDAEIVQEEVFGPVVTVQRFRGEDEAVRLANDTKYGLFATLWTRDPGRAQRTAAGVTAGTVGINHPYTTFPGVPFGGFKQSGFGREFAAETLSEYLESKSVLTWTSRRPANPFSLTRRHTEE